VNDPLADPPTDAPIDPLADPPIDAPTDPLADPLNDAPTDPLTDMVLEVLNVEVKVPDNVCRAVTDFEFVSDFD
jgi:hypothetical protein